MESARLEINFGVRYSRDQQLCKFCNKIVLDTYSTDTGL